MSARLLGIGFACDMGTPHRKLVLLKLIDACEDDGTRIFPAVATIARAAQCSARQVQRELAKMVETGLLRIVREGGRGPRSTREYALDVAFLRRIEADGWEAICAGGGDGAKGDRESPLDGGEKGDSGDTKRVTAATEKGDRLSHPTPPDPSLDPSIERERARASGEETEPEAGAPDDLADEENPDRAGFHKRVMRFCSGKGFATGPWPGWDESSPGWIGKQFASLSREERAEAERWRDPYLLDFRDRKGKPMKVGIFLRDRAWTGLEPALLDRFEQWRQAKLKPDERPRPDGWAACRGPVGMARLIAFLLAGPADGEAARALAALPVHSDPKLGQAWPKLLQWRLVLRQKGGLEFAPRWHALKDALEPVPAGTDMLAAWKAEFERRGWPWLVEFDHGDVVYLPKGGPQGLGDFEEALARIGAEKGEGQQEAAE